MTDNTGQTRVVPSGGDGESCAVGGERTRSQPRVRDRRPAGEGRRGRCVSRARGRIPRALRGLADRVAGGDLRRDARRRHDRPDRHRSDPEPAGGDRPRRDRAGKHVVTDKPGLTTMDQLDAVRAAIADKPGRPWTVLFTERYENRAISEAVRLARAGAVGRIVHVIGAGPAHDVGQAATRLVLGPRRHRWDPRRHRLAPGRPVPHDHRPDRRRRRRGHLRRRQRRLARPSGDAGHRLDDPRRTPTW